MVEFIGKMSKLYGILSATAIFLVLGIPTALIPTGLFKRMTQVTVFDYFFLFLVTVLFGIFISIYLKNKRTNKKTCVAAGGFFSGWLAVICPICTSVLVYIFGASFLLTYFDPVRPVFGFLSVIVLVILIHTEIKNTNSKFTKTKI